MKAVATLAMTLASAAVSSLAQAHESAVPHTHPHLHTVDGALLGFDVLALVALVLAGISGVALVRVRARRKK